MKFINDQYEKYLQEEVNINRKKRIPDTRVHCCLYFIPATGHSYVPPARSLSAPDPPLAPTLHPTHLSPSSLPGRAEDRLGPGWSGAWAVPSQGRRSGGPGRWAETLQLCFFSTYLPLRAGRWSIRGVLTMR